MDISLMGMRLDNDHLETGCCPETVWDADWDKHAGSCAQRLLGFRKQTLAEDSIATSLEHISDWMIGWRRMSLTKATVKCFASFIDSP